VPKASVFHFNGSSPSVHLPKQFVPKASCFIMAALLLHAPKQFVPVASALYVVVLPGHKPKQVSFAFGL
jgi:hypothetical protein